MLQQTTVSAVRGRYEAFLSRFPDLPSLARAREDSVLSAWSGLGYYARARNLRRAARRILQKHGGRIPRDPAGLRRLPGFGEYTAAAVACLAFGARHPAADANVTRVLSRLYGIEGMAGARDHREAVREHAARLLPRANPGRLTAAMMDLGQLVCTARRPRCAFCPIAEQCAALRGGSPESFPRRPKKPSSVTVFLAAACARRDGRALLSRRRARLLAGLWEFPTAEGNTPGAARRRLAAKVRSLGLDLDRLALGKTRHTVVNRRLCIEVFPAVSETRSAIPDSGLPGTRWFTPRQLAGAAIPTLTRKVARVAGFLL